MMACPTVTQDSRACIKWRQPARMPVFALGIESDMAWSELALYQNRTAADKVVEGTERRIFDNRALLNCVVNTGESVMSHSSAEESKP